VNWEKLFGEEGVRWFHTGGIFAALASNTAEAVIEAVEVAKKYGTVVAYDLNYRASLWKSQGGKEGAQRVNREIAKYVDVMIGNEEDFTACLGFEVEGADEHLTHIETDSFKKMIQTAVAAFPNFKVAATTLRKATTATLNDWSALLYYQGELYQSMKRENLEIYDRVGGGDGFASGLAYGFLEGKGPQAAVEYGAAHGALGDDHAGRHLDGARRRGGGGNEGQGRAGHSVMAPLSNCTNTDINSGVCPTILRRMPSPSSVHGVAALSKKCCIGLVLCCVQQCCTRY
jgi:sugar/nucleoside kinase (ribokinase family)